MDGENPRERAHLTEDFLSTLVDRGYVRPDASVPVADARQWFGKRDRQLAADIILDLIKEDGSVEYAGDSENRIWVTSEADAEKYIEELREDPPWFDW